jgi:hypothetical protein
MEGDIFARLPPVSSSPLDLSETFSWSAGRNPSSPFAFLQSPSHKEKENTDESVEVKYNYDAMPPFPISYPLPLAKTPPIIFHESVSPSPYVVSNLQKASPFAFPLQSNEKKNTAVDDSEEVRYNYDAMPPSLSPIPCQNPTNHLT